MAKRKKKNKKEKSQIDRIADKMQELQINQQGLLEKLMESISDLTQNYYEYGIAAGQHSALSSLVEASVELEKEKK